MTAPAETLAALRLAEGDLRAVGRIAELTLIEGEALAVTSIELAPAQEA